MAKIITAQEAAALLKDGDTLATGGFVGIGHAEALTTALEERYLAEGAPRTFVLSSKEVLEAIEQPLTGIVDAVKGVLEQCPPELAADIFERGMVLTGGGALLQNLDVLLSKSTGVPVIVAEDPLTCVARGGGKALDMIDTHGGDVFGDYN